DGPASLIGLVQLGVLEFHVWGSRRDDLEHPDILVFDLDPDPEVSWSRVVAAATVLDERLRARGLASFPRATGGKGLHLVVPIARSATWDEAKDFCHATALSLAREHAKELTANMAKARRVGKIFIDYLRNGRGSTAIASYSTRAAAGAPIAVPVAWDELRERPRVQPRFLLRDAPAWIADHRDVWRGFDA